MTTRSGKFRYFVPVALMLGVAIIAPMPTNAAPDVLNVTGILNDGLQAGEMDVLRTTGADVSKPPTTISYLPAAQDKPDAMAAFSDAMAATSPDANGYAIDIGDRLKIAFYGRDDLSGEYTVRGSGEISIPLLGTIQVGGKTQARIQREIAILCERQLNRSVDVTVSVVEWRSIYVVGHVNKPGAFPFVPNMTVLRAMAIAGGQFRDATATSYNVDLIREEWSRRRAVDQLKQALARFSRLRAERLGLDTVKPDIRLLRLATPIEVAELMMLETRMLKTERHISKRKVRHLKQAETYSKKELAAHKERLRHIQDQVQAYTVHLAKLSGLAERGIVRRSTVFDLKNQISSLGGGETGIIAQISQSQRALAQLQQDRESETMVRSQGIAEKIKQVMEEIQTHELAVRGSEEMMRQMASSPLLQVSMGAPAIRYKVVRSMLGKSTEFYATEAMKMLPGDVLHVIPPVIASTPRLEASCTNCGRLHGPNATSGSELRDNMDGIPVVKTGFNSRPDLAAQSDAKYRSLVAELISVKLQLKAKIEDESKARAAAEIGAKHYKKLELEMAGLRSTLQQFIESQSKPATIKIVPPKPTTETNDNVAAKAADKVASPSGSAKMAKPVKKKTTYSWKESRAFIKNLQTELKRVGCNPGVVDGIWGPKSKSALRRFSVRSEQTMGSMWPTNSTLHQVQAMQHSVCTA